MKNAEGFKFMKNEKTYNGGNKQYRGNQGDWNGNQGYYDKGQGKGYYKKKEGFQQRQTQPFSHLAANDGGEQRVFRAKAPSQI